MTGLLLSHQCSLHYGMELVQYAATERRGLELLVLPESREERLVEADCQRVEAAFFSPDVFPDFSRQFFSAARKSARLKWLHVFNVGIDHPIYAEMLERGVRLTTSSGSTAVPIAHTAIAALLMLARNFPSWIDAQRNRVWRPMQGNEVPADLSGQTALILGLGHIGREVARMAKALGLYIVGTRRTLRAVDNPVDELHAPDKVAHLLPRAQWLIIACPLTDETRGLIDAEAIARLPRGARIINIARGEIIQEPALIAALASGHLAGAYLDVFQQEPLPPDSPLWAMPNVLITPHNSGAAAGNDRRVFEIFRENLGRWMRGEALLNEVRRAS
jgi:phosphoglycerate dehydrogenase-like enzyme